MVVFILTNGSKVDTEDIIILTLGIILTLASFILGFLSVSAVYDIISTHAP